MTKPYIVGETVAKRHAQKHAKLVFFCTTKVCCRGNPKRNMNASERGLNAAYLLDIQDGIHRKQFDRLRGCLTNENAWIRTARNHRPGVVWCHSKDKTDFWWGCKYLTSSCWVVTFRSFCAEKRSITRACRIEKRTNLFLKWISFVISNIQISFDTTIGC